jgi:hypothetical protein
MNFPLKLDDQSRKNINNIFKFSGELKILKLHTENIKSLFDTLSQNSSCVG